MGRGVGQVVSVLAFYSNNLSLNPAEAYSFFLKNLSLKRTKINKKRPGLAHFIKSHLVNSDDIIVIFVCGERLRSYFSCCSCL